MYNHKTCESFFFFCCYKSDSRTTGNAIQCMVVDALIAAEPHLNISRRVESPKSYLHLTDDILLEIERSEDPLLKEAQAILHRLRVRDLYSLTNTVHLSYSARSEIKTILTAENIVKEAQNLKASLADELCAEHISVDVAPLHWGMKDRNPFDTIKFYHGKNNIYGQLSIHWHLTFRSLTIKHQSSESFHIGARDKTLIFPQVFAEVIVRVYSKDKKSVYNVDDQHRLPTDVSFIDTSRSSGLLSTPWYIEVCRTVFRSCYLYTVGCAELAALS